MVEMSEHAASTGRTVDWGFVRARLGSFLAVVPLSFWVINHLWRNLSAFRGSQAWTEDVTTYSHPLAFFVSSTVALLPLALHTVWGISRIASTRPNKLPFFSNVKYVLQRLSAIGLLLFLGAHLWLAMLQPRLMTQRPEAFTDIAHEMHYHGPTLVVYVLGVLGISYHLANGLSTFAMGWGLVSSRRALRKFDIVTWVVFALLLVLGLGAVYALWSAGGELPAVMPHASH